MGRKSREYFSGSTSWASSISKRREAVEGAAGEAVLGFGVGGGVLEFGVVGVSSVLSGGVRVGCGHRGGETDARGVLCGFP